MGTINKGIVNQSAYLMTRTVHILYVALTLVTTILIINGQQDLFKNVTDGSKSARWFRDEWKRYSVLNLRHISQFLRALNSQHIHIPSTAHIKSLFFRAFHECSEEHLITTPIRPVVFLCNDTEPIRLQHLAFISEKHRKLVHSTSGGLHSMCVIMSCESLLFVFLFKHKSPSVRNVAHLQVKTVKVYPKTVLLRKYLKFKRSKLFGRYDRVRLYSSCYVLSHNESSYKLMSTSVEQKQQGENRFEFQSRSNTEQAETFSGTMNDSKLGDSKSKVPDSHGVHRRHRRSVSCNRAVCRCQSDNVTSICEAMANSGCPINDCPLGMTVDKRGSCTHVCSGGKKYGFLPSGTTSHCERTCECPNKTCHAVTGECMGACSYGDSRRACMKAACPWNRARPEEDCSHRCQCHHTSCDPYTGACRLDLCKLIKYHCDETPTSIHVVWAAEGCACVLALVLWTLGMIGAWFKLRKL